MYYTVYKITDLINNKIYIGVHKTKDINDDYMGSGKILKRAQEKYGIENFRKEILEVYDNPEDMFYMESVLVNEDFVNDKETYNLKVGGEGGWDHCNTNSKMQSKKAIKSNQVQKEIAKNNPEWVKQKSEKISKGNKLAHKEGRMKSFTGQEFKGKKHSDETKKKIGKANSKYQKGEGNSQFGSMWIYSLEEKLNKKIKKDEFPNYENNGWIKGRKMKF